MPVSEEAQARAPERIATTGDGHDASVVPLPQGPRRVASEEAPAARAGWATPARLLLALALVLGALSHGVNLFNYPLYITDEGIYMQQAWAVLREGRLSPYTYFYDHAPAGWLVIAAWVQLLPLQFQTFGLAANAGRLLMLVLHLANVVLLFRFTHRISGSLVAAFVAAFLFNLSPLAVFYQRQVLLDNFMVFWILASLSLAVTAEDRVVTRIASGVAFGLAVLSKENAVFFGPVLAYLLYRRAQAHAHRRFAISFWAFSSAAVVSLYFLYAVLKDELLPSGLNFDLDNPPADHVALLYTIWWQLHRSQGSILDPTSLVWQFSLGAWLPKDAFLLAAGVGAALVNVVLGLWERRRDVGFLVAGLLALFYGVYLVRGSQMLEFYVVPIVPFLAVNIGMLAGRVIERRPPLERIAAVALFAGALVLHPTSGYVLVRDEAEKIVPHDLYKLSLTSLQAEQLAFVRANVPADAKIITDDDLWVDLHDRRPPYKWAHSHWKASADPDVRDKLFQKNWRAVDYVVLSNKMRQTMEQNNADGRYGWIFEALDRSERIWSLERGDVQLEVLRVRK